MIPHKQYWRLYDLTFVFLPINSIKDYYITFSNNELTVSTTSIDEIDMQIDMPIERQTY